MARFSTQVVVEACPHRVWDVLADFERWPQWTPTMRRIDILDNLPIGTGTRVRIEQPKLIPAIWTISAWNPKRCLVWDSNRPGLRVSARHHVEEIADGASVTLTVCFNGLLGNLTGLAMSSLTNTYLALEASCLKQHCERALQPNPAPNLHLEILSVY